MRKYLAYIVSIVALFVPGFAFAQVAGNMSSYNLFTPPIGDKSINYLGQVFGTVGGVIHGTSGQLLSEVFRVFNYAMVVVASLILIYSIIRSIIDTATEGEFMGRKNNSAWLIVRAVMGIGILVPKYTGYSLIQVFIMWVAVQGIGLADSVWARALDYLGKEGGVVYVEPAGGFTKGNMGKTLEQVGAVLNSEVCMYKLQDVAQKDRNEAIADLKKDPNNPILQQRAKQTFAQYRPVWNNSAKTVSFGIPNSNTQAATVCGGASWQKGNSAEDQNFERYERSGLEQIVSNLAPVAKSIADTSDQSLTSQQKDTLKQRAVRDVLGATADYENIMIPALNSAKANASKDWTTSLQEARDKGWIVAGSYYWELAQINNKVNEEVSNYHFTPSSPNIGALDSKQQQAVKGAQQQMQVYANIKDLRDKLKILEDRVDPGINPAYKAQLVAALDKMAKNPQEFSDQLDQISKQLKGANQEDYAVSHRDKVKSAVMITAAGATAVAGTFVVPSVAIGMAGFFGGIGSLVGVWFEHMNTVGDPLVMLQTMGRAMIGIAVTTWMISMIGVAAASAIISAGSVFTTAWLQAIEHGLKIFTPVFLAFIAVVFVNGMVLSVYVPLIPFFIFTFASIGWLISVFEAIIAGPLVAAAVTHPEGHDLLGKAEQSVMLLMGVFLRPVVMIIGFLASMIICRVALRIVFAGFQHITEAANITMTGANIFGTMGLMVILTTISSTIITMVFTAGVVKAWETMWMWIGFHQPSSSVESALHDIKGGIQAGAQAGGDFISGTGKSAADRKGVTAKSKDGKAIADIQKHNG